MLQKGFWVGMSEDQIYDMKYEFKKAIEGVCEDYGVDIENEELDIKIYFTDMTEDRIDTELEDKLCLIL